MSISGWVESAVPTPGPSPWIRLNTPAGTPALSITSAKIAADPGHSSLGFRIIVLPAASAGATLATIWFIGQFHGVISATTPIGSCTTRLLPAFSVNSNSLSAAIAAMKWPTPLPTCAVFATEIGQPISVAIASAMSFARFLYSARTASSSATRSSTVVC